MTWDTTPASARRLYRTSRKNAAVRGIPFELTQAEFGALWSEANGVCAMSGRIFAEPEGKSKWRRNPWGASLDRVRNEHGYRVGNCRLVSACVNIALNEWGEEVLMKMAMGLLGFDAGTHPPARHGTGLPRGITISRRKNGRPYFRVRIVVDNKVTDCGSFSTLPEAVARLDDEKPTKSVGAQVAAMYASGLRANR